MIPALILIGLMFVVGLVLFLLDRFRPPTDSPSPETESNESPTSCADENCVLHDTCPSEQLLRGVCEDKIVYYDDEELDAFIGHDPSTYTEADEEQFRDVIYTLRREELMPWYQSISRRGIKLSDTLYRELLALASE